MPVNLTFGGNAVYNLTGSGLIPVINGKPLALRANPQLGFQGHNPPTSPTISIAAIDDMPGQLMGYLNLTSAAPNYIKEQGEALGTVIKTMNTWWAPDGFWAASTELGAQPHDFFMVPLLISGGSFSIGASQATR
jgi:hypothetical protein